MKHLWKSDVCVHCQLRRKTLASKTSSVYGKRPASHQYLVRDVWTANRPDCLTNQQSLFDDNRVQAAIETVPADRVPHGPKAGGRARGSTGLAWERVSGSEGLVVAGRIQSVDGVGIDILVSEDDRFFGTVADWEIRFVCDGHVTRRERTRDSAYDAKKLAERLTKNTFYLRDTVVELWRGGEVVWRVGI